MKLYRCADFEDGPSVLMEGDANMLKVAAFVTNQAGMWTQM